MTDPVPAVAAITAADLGAQARALGPADIVVGIASYNNAYFARWRICNHKLK